MINITITILFKAHPAMLLPLKQVHPMICSFPMILNTAAMRINPFILLALFECACNNLLTHKILTSIFNEKHYTYYIQT